MREDNGVAQGPIGPLMSSGMACASETQISTGLSLVDELSGGLPDRCTSRQTRAIVDLTWIRRWYLNVPAPCSFVAGVCVGRRNSPKKRRCGLADGADPRVRPNWTTRSESFLLPVSSFGDEYAAPGGREKLARPTSTASTRIRENRRIGKSFLPGASVIIRLCRTPPLSVSRTALETSDHLVIIGCRIGVIPLLRRINRTAHAAQSNSD